MGQVALGSTLNEDGDKAPDEQRHGWPEQHLDQAYRAAAVYEDVTQHHHTDALRAHRPPPSVIHSPLRAMRMNTSSRSRVRNCSIACAGVPSVINRPLCKKSTRSQISSISRMLCEVYSMATPSSCCTRRRILRTLSAMSGSRLAVGSSSNNSSGRFSKALQRLTRLTSPLE